MKKSFALVTFGVVALFAALPTPVVAGFWDREDPDQVRFQDRFIVRIMARRRGVDPEDTYPGFFHQVGGYYYQDGGASYYYPSYYYPSTSYYPQEPAVDVNAAMIRMHVPSGARVWFEGDETSQTGEDRDFISPSLTPGHEYVYHIRVQWNENNKAVERKREVKVHAGDRINLNFDR